MLISIVTVTFNDPEGLRKTFESVCDLIDKSSRCSLDFEWTVIDGGSGFGDRHRQLRESVEAAATVFVSEPDRGIYHAMNKGIGRSSGDYLWFLNSGDVAVDEILKLDVTSVSSQGEPCMVWGHARYRLPSGELVDVTSRGAAFIRYSNPVCHQAMLFSSRVLAIETYNEHYTSAGDYELVARLLQKNCGVLQSDCVFCVYDSVGMSSDNSWRSMIESNRVRHKILGMNRLTASLIGILKLVYITVSNSFPALKKHYRKRSARD